MEGLSEETGWGGRASGAAGAAAGFVRRLQSRVYGLALTMLRDADLAEEVAQETFVRAWRHAATYDARRGRVPTWLLAIARNLAIDRVRMRSAVPVDPEVIASELDLARIDPPVDVAERDRLRRGGGRPAPPPGPPRPGGGAGAGGGRGPRRGGGPPRSGGGSCCGPRATTA